MSINMKNRMNNLRNDALRLASTDDPAARMVILKGMQCNIATIENELGRLENLTHRMQLRIGVLAKLLPNDVKEALR